MQAYRWQRSGSAASGSFSDAAHWGGTVPGSADQAQLFGGSFGPYNVTLRRASRRVSTT